MLSKFVIVISANHVCVSVACSVPQPCPSGTLLERTATLSMGAVALQTQLPRYCPFGRIFSGSLQAGSQEPTE